MRAILLFVALALAACVRTEPPASPLVRQEPATFHCQADDASRVARLAWEPVTGASHYELVEVSSDSCCDYEYAAWPEARWQSGRATASIDPFSPTRLVTSTYWRLRAVTPDGVPSPWTHGMWSCWVD